MAIAFCKYQGTGNDFILVDNRDSTALLTREQVALLCHRRYGIGADGLMLLEQAEGYDFRMVYFNADGGESTMCGNGGRCITAFALRLGMVQDEANFVAIDGPHKATINGDGTINLHMQDVAHIAHADGFSVLNTGSPHYVKWVEDVRQVPVYTEGKMIRNMAQFSPGGINANFAHWEDGGLWVRTYERGVEDETLSCGTGVAAAAIAATADKTGAYNTTVYTPGGILQVSFIKDTVGTAKDVVLTGPAVYVYEGTW
jgi:diaminopimelate epimerase